MAFRKGSLSASSNISWNLIGNDDFMVLGEDGKVRMGNEEQGMFVGLLVQGEFPLKLPTIANFHPIVETSLF